MAYFDTTWYCNAGDQSTTGYYAVAKRPQNTAVVAGQIVRQFTTPAVGSERCFIAIQGGTTANTTDASWTLTRGGTTIDGTVTWQECTGQAALNGDGINVLTWAQLKALGTPSVGFIIKRNNGASYQINGGGTTLGASEPAFSDTAGASTSESGGTALWRSLGPVSNFTGGQAPFARLASVFGTNWFAAGNTLYVGDNHAESQTAAISMSPAGTLATIGKILCHNSSGSYPPTASDLMTGASMATSASANISLFGPSSGAVYVYGLTFRAGVGGATGNVAIGASGSWITFDNCTFEIANSGSVVANSGVAFGSGTPGSIVLNNCKVKFANAGQGVVINSNQFLWQNTGTVLVSGSSVPTNFLFVGANNLELAVLEALDLSQLSGGLISYSAGAMTFGQILVKDCKLHASMTVATPQGTNLAIQLVRSDSGATAYKSTRYTYEGTETTETSIVRTGGATDPTGQAQTRKITTTANSQWLRPFKAEPYAVWNPTIGANVTVTVCGTVNAGALPNNDDIWMEVEYLGDAGSSVAYTTFNSADVSNMTLSGGDLVATATGNGAGVRSIGSISSGKYYFEYTYTTINTNGFDVGIGSATYNLNTGSMLGVALVLRLNGTIYVNNVNPGGAVLGTINAGNVIGVAIDMAAKLIWFRVAPSGNWNGSGTANPATGTGGFDTSALNSTLYGLMIGGTSDKVTANFGGSAFTGAVPSGFTSGLSVSVTPVASPLGKIVTTTKASVLASNAAVSSDSSVWSLPYTTFDGTPSAAVVMSNGNLTVTHGSGNNGVGVTSTGSLIAGKYYFEITATLRDAIADGAGIAPTVGGVFVDPGSTHTNAVGATFGGSTTIFTNGTNTGKNLGNYLTGGVLGVAVDLTARLAWIRIGSGNWNADAAANPATGVGGVTVPSGALAPFVRFANSSATNAYTANFGVTSFANAAPSGFGNWSGWTPFKLTTTLSSPQPQLPGYLHARIRAAKTFTIYYIDPQVTLS